MSVFEIKYACDRGEPARTLSCSFFCLVADNIDVHSFFLSYITFTRGALQIISYESVLLMSAAFRVINSSRSSFQLMKMSGRTSHVNFFVFVDSMDALAAANASSVRRPCAFSAFNFASSTAAAIVLAMSMPVVCVDTAAVLSGDSADLSGGVRSGYVRDDV